MKAATPTKFRVQDARALLLMALSIFYGIGSNMKVLIDITTGNSVVSLRLIDWFVTNYAKKHTIIIKDPTTGSHLNVFISYRSQLKAYTKHMFDPFRRRERIMFHYKADGVSSLEKSIETTVGQLNFFRWLIQNNILQYIHDNVAKIENDMASIRQPHCDECNEMENTKSHAGKITRFMIMQKNHTSVTFD